MTTEPSKFFFSYSREDSELVLKLAKELRKVGGSLWLDQLDIRGGSRWDEAVQAALESCQGLVAVLSPSSVASQNFLDEVSYALDERKQVIPLLYRECAIPFRLRRVQYVNFTAGYEDGFAGLLRALGLEMPESAVAPPVIEARAPEQGEEEVAGKGAERKVDQATAGRRFSPLIATRYKVLYPRMIGALVGAAVGATLGALVFLLLGESDDRSSWLIGVFSAGVPCALAGLFAGTDRRRIAVILALAPLVGTAMAIASQEPPRDFFFILFMGMSWGALLGPIVILLGSIAKSIRKRLRGP